MGSPVTQITDYAAQFKADTLSQFWAAPKLQAVVGAFAAEVQRFEDFAYSVLTDRMLDAATGDVLDQIGKIPRVARLGRTDTEYRRIIKVAIAARNSDGGAEEIIWIATQLFGETVRYVQEGAAHYRLEYITDAAPLSAGFVAEAVDLITRATPAGVGFVILTGTVTTSSRFDEGTFDAATFGTVVGEAQ